MDLYLFKVGGRILVDVAVTYPRAEITGRGSYRDLVHIRTVLFCCHTIDPGYVTNAIHRLVQDHVTWSLGVPHLDVNVVNFKILKVKRIV